MTSCGGGEFRRTLSRMHTFFATEALEKRASAVPAVPATHAPAQPTAMPAVPATHPDMAAHLKKMLDAGEFRVVKGMFGPRKTSEHSMAQPLTAADHAPLAATIKQHLAQPDPRIIRSGMFGGPKPEVPPQPMTIRI